MVDFQLSLSRQFEMYTDLEEQVKFHKNYETKTDHYSRQLHYYNILLNAQVVDPPVKSGDSPTKIPNSQDVQPVKTLDEAELTRTMVSTTLGVDAGLIIPKMTPSKETSTRASAVEILIQNFTLFSDDP